MSRQDKLPPLPDSSGSEEPDDDDILLQINLRLRLDEIADLEAKQLSVRARRQPHYRELWSLAGRIYEARRMRERIFDDKYFGEPAWDMLLALYYLPKRGEVLSISSLGYASNVPPTSAARWQRILEAEQLIEYGPWAGKDRRVRLVRLTERGKALMEEYLTRLFYCERPMPPPTGQE